MLVSDRLSGASWAACSPRRLGHVQRSLVSAGWLVMRHASTAGTNRLVMVVHLARTCALPWVQVWPAAGEAAFSAEEGCSGCVSSGSWSAGVHLVPGGWGTCSACLAGWRMRQREAPAGFRCSAVCAFWAGNGWSFEPALAAAAWRASRLALAGTAAAQLLCIGVW